MSKAPRGYSYATFAVSPHGMHAPNKAFYGWPNAQDVGSTPSIIAITVRRPQLGRHI